LHFSHTNIYAKYLRKYVQAYAEEGIEINFLVPQNEPEHRANGYPTMAISAEDEAVLVKALIDEFEAHDVHTQVVIFGHNFAQVNYPLKVLEDLGDDYRAKVGGVAWHCYDGDFKWVKTVLRTVIDCFLDLPTKYQMLIQEPECSLKNVQGEMFSCN